MLFSSVMAFLAAPFMFKPAETVPKPKSGSINHMIAFFDSKPADGQYHWGSARTCALAQWGKTLKKPMFSGPTNYRAARNAAYEWNGSYDDAEDKIAEPYPHTWGAIATRARAYKAEQGL